MIRLYHKILDKYVRFLFKDGFSDVHVWLNLNLIMILILFIWEFFSPDLANGFLLESDWQQVSSVHQDYSQYPGQSKQLRSLDGLDSSSYSQILWWI